MKLVFWAMEKPRIWIREKRNLNAKLRTIRFQVKALFYEVEQTSLSLPARFWDEDDPEIASVIALRKWIRLVRKRSVSQNGNSIR
ncbi:hypothetical protein NPIL_141641 [Nephila pilipes]|uniref:Uncharacterized protein n=1 Tax=Nephila pilipes TaxID=299642 RepID=A0A8X6IDX4_NEPPI|nr:hypothetical protein NPIL_141641 [Nephila pilipes]